MSAFLFAQKTGDVIYKVCIIASVQTCKAKR